MHSSPTLPDVRVAAPPPLPGNPAQVRRRLWLTVALVLIAVLIGGGWDGYYHLTHPFNGFWVPPHIFIYSACLLAAGVILSMLLTPKIRLALGPSFAVPFLRMPVPGALFILGSGITLAGVGGLVFDNAWHTAFGLDETLWSFPHAMIGWAELMLTLGFIACFLAVRRPLPLHWSMTLFLGVLLMLASAVPFMGPLVANRSIALLQAQVATSALAAQPASLHALRIYTAWNLTRTNPMLIVLAPLWAGATLAFIRKLDPRPWLLVLVVAVWTILDTGHKATALAGANPDLVTNAANWEPLPLLAPAVLLVILPLARIPARWVWAIAGLVLGALIAHTFAPLASLVLVLGAMPTMVLGKLIGERAYTVVAQPDRLAPVLTLALMGMAVPAVMGMIDLTLRLTTP